MTHLQIKSHPANSAAEARETIAGLAVGCGDPAWTITQSFEKLEFSHYTGKLPELEKIFTGRIFGADAEIRWWREDEKWMIWSLREGADRNPVIKRLQRYYLWGIYDSGRFAEDRIPGVPQYPLHNTPQNQDRAYIEVAEYELNEPLEKTPERLTLQLNQPRLYAHRFVGLDAGRTQPTKGE